MSKVKLVTLFYESVPQCDLSLGDKKSQCMFGGKHGLGKVRTEHVKRLARELVRRFPNKFSKDFEGNKQAVNVLTQGATPKVRNQIAGYITHIFVGMPMTSSDENTEESE